MDTKIGPESKKFLEARQHSEQIGEFMDWLTQEKGLVLGFWEGDEIYPYTANINKLLYEFFGINEQALEAERREILKQYREAQDGQ